MTERVLVTGAQGFVGRYTLSALLASGAEVLGSGRSPRLDHSFTHEFEIAGSWQLAPLLERFTGLTAKGYAYMPCDLGDAEAVAALVRAYRPNRVIHLAGALRDEGEQALMHSNTAATGNLVGAVARWAPSASVVLGSSGSVFGNQQQLPVGEDAVPAPVGSYAVSKRESEIIATEIALEADLSLDIARIFNLLGPGLQSRHLPGYLAHKIAEIEAGLCPPRIELGSLATTRDFIDARDVAQWLVQGPRQAGLRHYNLASGVEVEMRQLVACFAQLAAVPFSIESNEARNRVGADRYVAQTRVRDWVPSLISLQQSVQDMLDYARCCVRLREPQAAP